MAIKDFYTRAGLTVGNGIISTPVTTATLLATPATVAAFAAATTLTIGNTVATATISVGGGATVSGATKTVNVGTNGVTGSITNVLVGSGNGGTTTINSPSLDASSAVVSLFATPATVNLFSAAITTGSKLIIIGGNGAGSSTTVINVGTPTGGTTNLLGSSTATTVALDTNATNIATTAFVRGLAKNILNIDGAQGGRALTAVEAASAIINFSGALTNNALFTVPDGVIGPFLVYNSTSNNFNLTISQTGVGVIVAQGKVAYLIATGSGVLSVNNLVDGFLSGSAVATRLRGIRYDETVSAIIAGATTSLNLDNGNIFEVTPGTGNSSTTFSFLNPPPNNGSASVFIVKLKIGAGGYSATWPSSVRWPNNAAPGISVGANTFVFYTTDGGQLYYGFLSGQNANLS